MAWDRLSGLLPNVLKKRGLHQVAVAGSAVGAAQRWMEANMGLQAASLKASKLADGSLFIEAHNGIALSEMSRRVPQLLDALRAEGYVVDAIRCRRAASGG